MKFIFLSFLFSFQSVMAVPRPDVAVVEKVRGTATLLVPGSVLARKISEGDKLKEDSSIVTGRGSFIRVRFIDNSVLSLGPESKAVIVQVDQKEPSVVSLLKGKMRASVQPNAEGKEKFYVKTRTAAMGVRGTEFQSIYNPENKITNLLTYSGEVAMVKTDDTQLLDVEKEYVRDENGSLQVSQVVKGVGPEHMELGKILKSEDAVVVKSGQFSGSMEGLTKVTEPVIVNPIQVNALFKNTEYLQKRDSKIIESELDSTQAQDLIIRPVPQEAPPEGLIDLNKKVFAPKSGGIIDLESGIYVPPGKDAIFDPKNKIFIDSSVGVIDRHTGQYEPPQGLKLDPVRGFMIDQKEVKDKSTVPTLLAQADSLNKIVGTDVVLTSKTVDRLKTFERYSQSELVSKNSAEFVYMPYSQELVVNNDTRLSGTTTIKSKSAELYQLIWGMSGFRFTRPLFELTVRREEFDSADLNGIIQDTRDLMGMGLRLDYAQGERTRHTLRFSLMQEYFVDHSGSTTVIDSLKKVSVPRISYTFFWNAIVSGALSLNTRLGLSTNLPRESGTFKVETGMGMHFGLDLAYWMSQHWRIGTGYNFFTETQEISNTLYTSENKRTSNGLQIFISRIF